MRPVFEAVRGIGIDHQSNSRKLEPQPLDGSDVVPRLNLDLNTLVARGKLSFDGRNKFLKRFFNSDRNTTGNLAARSPEQLPERYARLFRLRVPDGGFDGALGHVVAANRLERSPNLSGAGEFPRFQ